METAKEITKSEEFWSWYEAHYGNGVFINIRKSSGKKHHVPCTKHYPPTQAEKEKSFFDRTVVVATTASALDAWAKQNLQRVPEQCRDCAKGKS